MDFKKFRDLNLIRINDTETIVISCDSAGGIGLKQGDLVKVSPEITGYYTVSVCLMELLSFGARPISIVNTLASEMDRTGLDVISGIKRAIKPLGLSDEIITGTTEENIETIMTGIGITAVGIINNKEISFKKSKVGNGIFVLGLPLVGDEVVRDNENSTMNLSRLNKLLKLDFIDEVLPVGSKGIGYEVKEMAKTNGLNYKLIENNLDLLKTAGPSTCVIISMVEDNFASLNELMDIPLEQVGYFMGEENS